ncbi:hypothetical protein L596_004732 [Steinernema carpocapsae]|uniref:Acyl-CoA dehydrogenase/oxidase N-terminal domain-containing protein n=1 Tax=Steinernema carpocapsae TaxID=34508 RepID=A0A4U8UXS8_STECR|nr:hypothetical protein L596_004732 [Steinernema carpocapsae]
MHLAGRSIARLRTPRVSVVVRRFTSSDKTPVEVNPKGRQLISRKTFDLIAESGASVEKWSLSRGLSMNKFEKDFMIYPEYTETDDVEMIKGYTETFRKDLEKALQALTKPQNGLSDEVMACLLKHNVVSTFVSKDFGGLGMCHKDLLKVYEVLGINWSVYTNVNAAHIFTNVLTIYGTEDQKQTYLPKIASGQCKPAICLHEEGMGTDLGAMKTEIFGGSKSTEKLKGRKMNVINGENADVYLVFAQRTVPGTTKRQLLCILVDRDELGDGSISIVEKKDMVGLKQSHVSTVDFDNVPVTYKNTLGSDNEIQEIAFEISCSNKMYFGSAVCSYMKNMLQTLSRHCNRTVQNGVALSAHTGVQKAITDLSLSVYVLETVSYYLGGLLDENLVIATDIENAIVHKYANKTLHQALITLVEIMGSAATDCSFKYHDIFGDVATLVSLGMSERDLTDQIAMGTLSTWVKQNTLLRPKFSFGRIFASADVNSTLHDPKMIHFVAEHAHPSLEPACRALEHSMSRLNAVIGKIAQEQGKTMNADYATISSLSEVIENNLGMLACIARASRSYSIGLRNRELELDWTIMYCTRTAVQTKTELECLGDHFGMVRLNPSILNVGRSVLELGGYCIESPIERNW